LQRHLVFQFIACAGLLLAGCTRNEPRADLVIVNGPEPETLDPALMTGQADGRIGLAIFEGLTRYDPVTAAPTPAIAERWETSADGLHYRFFLRTNAAWSTGCECWTRGPPASTPGNCFI
jgi:oligopeptide transport system substrate-binding protein